MKYPATHPFFLLDEHGEPYAVHDVHEWAEKFPAQHLIERTEIAETGFVVETVFMGKLSLYDFIGSPKSYNVSCYFETIVYGTNGVAVDGDKWNELGSVELGGAKRGHAAKVARWREILGVDCPVCGAEFWS